jgi:hypothetical protein
MILLAGIVLPAFAGKPVTTQMVTVEQLEQALATVHDVPDKKLAEQLGDMKLTERLSDTRLARLEKELPGPKARQALTALADESSFLDLPAADILSLPVPDHAAQAALLALTVDYVKKVVPNFPDLSATRETSDYAGTATVIPHDLHDDLFFQRLSHPKQERIGYQRLSPFETTSVEVLYHDGSEVSKTEVGFVCSNQGLGPPSGDFAPVLASVPGIAAQGKVVWSHWEIGAEGPQAVFRYELSHPSTLINVRDCSTGITMPMTVFDFHGEISVNPADGSVLRMTAVLRSNDKLHPSPSRITEFDIMATYATVKIGGVSCVCPVKRIALYLGPVFVIPIPTEAAFGDPSRSYGQFASMLVPNKLGGEFYRRYGLSEAPLLEYLNDITFGPYQAVPGGDAHTGQR